MSCMQCFNRHRCFKTGRASLENELSGRSFTNIIPENVEQIRQLVYEDHQRMIDISVIVSVSYGLVRTILTSELDMWHVAAKFIPWCRRNFPPQCVKIFVSVPQMNHHSHPGSSLVTSLGSVCMTLRESDSHHIGRAHHLDDQRRQEWAAAQWRACSSYFPISAAAFLIANLFPRARLSTEFYCCVVRCLRENIRQKRPDLWHAKNWILHDDNAPCHWALLLSFSPITTCYCFHKRHTRQI